MDYWLFNRLKVFLRSCLNDTDLGHTKGMITKGIRNASTTTLVDCARADRDSLTAGGLFSQCMSK